MHAVTDCVMYYTDAMSVHRGHYHASGVCTYVRFWLFHCCAVLQLQIVLSKSAVLFCVLRGAVMYALLHIVSPSMHFLFLHAQAVSSCAKGV